MSVSSNSPHIVKFPAFNGNGWEVCACGATRFVINGQSQGTWHTCALCVLTHAHESEKKP
jgi:hypothetical protein